MLAFVPGIDAVILSSCWPLCLPSCCFAVLLASVPVFLLFCCSAGLCAGLCLPAGLFASLPAFLPVSVCYVPCTMYHVAGLASVLASACLLASVLASVCLLASLLVCRRFCRSAGVLRVSWSTGRQPVAFLFVCLCLVFCCWWSHCHFTVDLCRLHLPCCLSFQLPNFQCL